jgi:hypothetical protein
VTNVAVRSGKDFYESSTSTRKPASNGPRNLGKSEVTMKKALMALGALFLAAPGFAAEATAPVRPPISSMMALAFHPEGVLFAGDGRSGAIFALELNDTTPRASKEPFNLIDVETKIAALLGARAGDILIHDMAVHPVTRNVYFAVSRGRGKWNSAFQLPNELADATELVRLNDKNQFEAVELAGKAFTQVALPKPVDASKEYTWKKGISLRAEMITDLAWQDGSLWVAGLSNEEFASAIWRVPYPFQGTASLTTVEIFHGAHATWETKAPIRTFVPYKIGDKDHLLAAYLCTPFVTFETAGLRDGAHVKGRTIGEFGSANYPLDMVVVKTGGETRLLIANSNLPLMVVKPEDIASFQGEITTEVAGYTGGIPYEIRPGAGIQQMDVFNDDNLLFLMRLPGGTLDLRTWPTSRI